MTAAAPVAVAAAPAAARRPGRRGRRGADRVHRRPDRDRPEQDPRHQGRPRAHRPWPQGGQGPRRRGPQGRSRRASPRTRPRRSRPPSRSRAPRSRSSSARHPRRGRAPAGARPAPRLPAPGGGRGHRPGLSARLTAAADRGTISNSVSAAFLPPPSSAKERFMLPVADSSSLAPSGRDLVRPDLREARDPQPDRAPGPIVRLVRREGPAGAVRRDQPDQGLHRQGDGAPVPGLRVRGAQVLRARVPDPGPDLQPAALRQGRAPDQGDGRDPAPARLHGRLPVDDRPGHVHHQRRRARRRQPARPLAGRLLRQGRGPQLGPRPVHAPR